MTEAAIPPLRDEGPSTRLLEEQQGGVVILTISNPPMRNALGPEVYTGLASIALRVRTDATIRAVVLTGANGVFCGGGNLNRISNNQLKTREFQANSVDVLHNAVKLIRTCPVPFIAAVEGAAAGAGFSIALQCDLIIAAEDARFVMAYVKSGLSPDGGGSAMLGQQLPRQLAFELMAFGDAISAQRLHALGVVSQCVPKGDALKVALAAAHRLAAGPRQTLGRIKRLSEQAAGSQAAQLDLERDMLVDSVHGAESKEGISAFLDKRTPDFSNPA